MAITARVAGHVDSLGETIDTTHTGSELLHFLLALVCGLVYEQNIDFSTLESLCILLVVTVPEQNSASVWKDDVLFGVVVGCDPLFLVWVIALEHLAHRVDMVFSKLRVGLTNNHDLYAWILQAQESCLDSNRPALAALASSRTTKGYVFFISCKKQLLPLIRCFNS